LKAVYITEQGEPSVLTYGEQPDPQIPPGYVLIRVGATALNHLDLFTRAGQRGTKREFKQPQILGCDIAGTVAELGADAQRLQVGQRVLVNPGITCGKCEYCTSANDNLCTSYRMIGVAVNGGYAEYVAVPWENCYPIPDWMDWAEAASIPLTFLTAWHMLFGRCGLRPGDNVLVMAGGSGVGTAAIRIAKRFGARVVTTASTDEKLARAREIGADEGINYTETPEFAAKVLELTDGRGADIVFDHIGATVWEQNFRCIARNGRFVNCGVTGGYRAELHIGQMFTRQLTLMGSFMGTKQEMGELMRVVQAGELRGVVAESMPLQDAARAHELMDSRDFFGKIVLTP
jgi:NADPH2:quinone reductase